MSMICTLLALSTAQIGALRAHPVLASDLAIATQDLASESARAEQLQRLPPQRRQELEAQWRAALASMPGAIEAQARTRAAASAVASLGVRTPPLDLQNSWHILHYLLTGHVDGAASPGDALVTGEPLGDDLGYGPPRLQDVASTAAFAGFLRPLDTARLESRIDYRRMTQLGVYSMPLGVSDEAADADLRREVNWSFPALKSYVIAAAAKHGGLLIWLS